MCALNTEHAVPIYEYGTKKKTAFLSYICNTMSVSVAPQNYLSKDMKVLSNGKIMKVQKARQRKILSCVYCHLKKVKCSRQHPMCDNCNKLGIECNYFVNERVSRGGKRSSKSHLDVNDLEMKPSNSQNSNNLTSSPQMRQESVSLSSDLTSSASPMSAHQQLSSIESTSSTSHDEEEGNKPKNEPNGPQSLIVPELAMNYLGLSMQSPHGALQSPQSTQNNQAANSLLQTPIHNNLNNITNNYFNTNYSNTGHNPTNDELYYFNLSSFTFANPAEQMVNQQNSHIMSPQVHSPQHESPSFNFKQQTNFENVEQTSTVTNFLDSNPQSFTNPMPASNAPTPGIPNPGLATQLAGYPSNPATTKNYLYGTNTYYENENLLDDLIKHLPPTKERSYELINRYVTSVHILLPVMVNLSDFVKEHDIYWEHHNPYATQSRTSSVSATANDRPSPTNSQSSSEGEDFNKLQFYTLYFSVLYAATISEFEEYDNLLLNQDIDKYLKAFNKICQYYNYPHGIKKVPLLLGNVIIQSTSPNPSTMEMSQIIRYAKFLQFHKDPIISLRISDWEVIKFRRMLWWVIFGLDALTSHNFCLPPVCRFDDFNVLMPDEEEPIFKENGQLKEKKLNVSVLALNIKFGFDRILSDLVYQLHNGLANNITPQEVDEIKGMIVNYFHESHKSVLKITAFYKKNPPQTVHEMNLINFVKNHSSSFVDRAIMLLHKKILLSDTTKDSRKDLTVNGKRDADSTLLDESDFLPKKRDGVLSLSQFEDTFGRIQEANIISNFDISSISLLKFNQFEDFTYENMTKNLIPSILHNLNDFLKYNDFFKFGKFNWYVKRTIPLDSIILMFVIITVKFKYEFMALNELVIYVKLINKALFILHRKWFKNEKYKRMLSLANMTWEYILKKFNIINLINQYMSLNLKRKQDFNMEFIDFHVSGYTNMTELFSIMDVPQPLLLDPQTRKLVPVTSDAHNSNAEESPKGTSMSRSSSGQLNDLAASFLHDNLMQGVDIASPELNAESMPHTSRSELVQMKEKLYYDLRNNYVDINDYCAFYSSLENILHELLDYINDNE